MVDWIPTRYPGYLINSKGQVIGATGRLMKGVVNPITGYRHITITANRSDTGKQKRAHVHHLVCEAFHGPRPKGLLALHRNGDKLDNRAENVYWGTARQNMEDSIQHGTAAIRPGEANINSKANRSRRLALGVVA